MVSRILLLSILILCIGASLYLLTLVDIAQICILLGLVFLIISGILSKRRFESTNKKVNGQDINDKSS